MQDVIQDYKLHFVVMLIRLFYPQSLSLLKIFMDIAI